MDPLSIASAVGGLAAIACQVSISLAALIESVREAPAYMKAVLAEVKAIESTLQELQKPFLDGRVQDPSPQWTSALNDSLNPCKETMVQLGNLTLELRSGKAGRFSQAFSQLKWTLREKEVTLLRSRLDGYKQTLILLLSTLSIGIGSRVEQTLEIVHKIVNQLAKQTITENPHMSEIFEEKKPQEPITSARALFDYDPAEDNELEFKEGDIIQIIEFIEKEWWVGSLNGQTGLFPANYVEIFEEKPQEQVTNARALFDYDPAEDNELEFKEGDIIQIIEFIEKEWWVGSLNGRTGLLPANYVSISP